MEEIDLKELFDFIKGKLGTLAIITISVCLLGCVYGLFIQKPMYSAITQNDININRNLVETYAQIVKSRRVLDQVICELKLDTTYEELNNKIAVTALNNTEIIKITVNDADAKKAMNIANVTASYFTDEIVDLYNMNNVNVLDKAFQSDTPYNINVMKQIIIYFMIGFVLAAGILFVIFYFDRTIKSVEQVEQKIKLPILGSVQELTKGGRK